MNGLTDKATRAVIVRRLMRLSAGNCGDVKPVGGGLSELRIDYGPGFRVYFGRCDSHVVLLLGGGDKSTQKADIRSALTLWEEIERTSE